MNDVMHYKIRVVTGDSSYNKAANANVKFSVSRNDEWLLTQALMAAMVNDNENGTVITHSNHCIVRRYLAVVRSAGSAIQAFRSGFRW